MIHSTRALEGLLTIDHRDSPGTTPEQVQRLAPAVGKGDVLKCPTAQCNHCQRMVILNPKRNRPRNHCAGCHDFICDGCAEIYLKTLECLPFVKVMEAQMETAINPSNVKALDIVQRFIRHHHEGGT